MRQIRLHTTRATEGVHITLAGRNVNTQIALVEHVTLDDKLARAAHLIAACHCWRCKPQGA